MTIPFYNLAIKNKIVSFHLKPYSTNITQPLDVEVFQSFKYYHTDAIEKSVQLGGENFGKLKFLSAFQLFHN